MVEVTRRQFEVIDFVNRFYAIHKKNPSISTVSQALKLTRSSAHAIMHRLNEIGVIERDYYSRNYKVVKEVSMKKAEY
jgi:DNA-binding IclR family transcriptional regulator